MRHALFAFVVLVIFAVGCGSIPEAPRSETAVRPKPEFQEPPVQVPPQLQGGQIPEIINHAVFFASSVDEKTWELSEEPIANMASVPDLLVLEKDVGWFAAGSVISHFVDASRILDGEDEGVSFVVSENGGQTWSDRIDVELVGGRGMIPVDPSVVQLEDGRLLMHFYDFSSARQPGTNATHTFYSAISEDGVGFHVQGPALVQSDTMTDPEIVRLGDTWFMYFAMHDDMPSIWVATSTDGFTFVDPVKVEGMRGIPGAMVVDDQVHLYGCDAGISFIVSDDGFDFGKSSGQVLRGNQDNPLICDPSPAQLPDGSYGLVVKQLVEN